MRSLHELSVLFRSASKQRAWGYELALFAAWHVAAFTQQAEHGKLKDFTHYRNKLTGAADTKQTPATPISWQERKAARERQVAQVKRHQAQRQRLPVKRPK